MYVCIDRTLLYVCMQYIHCVYTCTSEYNPVCTLYMYVCIDRTLLYVHVCMYIVFVHCVYTFTSCMYVCMQYVHMCIYVTCIHVRTSSCVLCFTVVWSLSLDVVETVLFYTSWVTWKWTMMSFLHNYYL